MVGNARNNADWYRLLDLCGITNARLAVQLWTTTNGCDTMVSVFNSSLNTLDVLAIGTHDDGPGANCVLTAIRP